MHRLVRSFCFAGAAGVLILQGCGKSAPGSTERANSAPAADRATAAASVASAPETRPDWKTHERLGVATYALVDPDESVRARAQEVFEQELARR